MMKTLTITDKESMVIYRTSLSEDKANAIIELLGEEQQVYF